jgi:hypothetical protein
MVRHRRAVLQQVLAEFPERELEKLAEGLERLVGAVDRFVQDAIDQRET